MRKSRPPGAIKPDNFHRPPNLRTKSLAGDSATFSLEQNEREMILHALEQCKGAHAAKMLGISRYPLLYRIKKHFTGGACCILRKRFSPRQILYFKRLKY